VVALGASAATVSHSSTKRNTKPNALKEANNHGYKEENIHRYGQPT